MSPLRPLMGVVLATTNCKNSSLVCLSTKTWNGPIFKKRCTLYRAGLTARQVADRRDSYFEKRRARFFDTHDLNFKNYIFFDAPNEARVEMRRRVIGEYLKGRPEWYTRLEQNTRTFNFETETFIKDLMVYQFTIIWKSQRVSLRRARLRIEKHFKSQESQPPNVVAGPTYYFLDVVEVTLSVYMCLMV